MKSIYYVMFSTVNRNQLSEAELRGIFTELVKVLNKARLYTNDVRCQQPNFDGTCSTCRTGLTLANNYCLSGVDYSLYIDDGQNTLGTGN